MSLPSDNSLDARLRDVPLPPGLKDRLKAALSPSDEELDEWLRRVAVPETLTIVLREVPGDAALDEQLADVPVPPALPSELRRIPQVERGQRVAGVAASLFRLALAACWLVALTVTSVGGIGAVVTAVLPLAGGGGMIATNSSPPSPGDQSDPPRDQYAILDTLTWDDEPPSRMPAPSRSALIDRIAIDPPTVWPARESGAAAEWSAALDGGLRPLDDIMLLKFRILGSPQQADDRLPEIEPPLAPRSVGIGLPLVRGYNRAYFLKHRQFPPISPAASAELASLSVPLVTDSDVLSRLVRSLADGRVPPRDELRSEEFLAAMNLRFAAAPAGQVSIRTAAGPSPFGSAGAELLQVGVQAGDLARRSQAATHLVLAIDLSQSMRRGGRLEMLQTALDRLLDRLGPRDRLSLVVFHEDIAHQVELATRDDVPALRRMIARLAPRGGTNLPVGLQTAVSLALADSPEPAAQRRLVLITDSQPQLPPQTQDQLRMLLMAAGEAGVRLDVLDIGERDVLDSVQIEWTENLSGETRPVRSARELSWALVEALTGSNPIVASETTLTLKFNPQAVAAYRLLGHEANALAEFAPASVQAELAAGEAASVLVELWFTPSDIDDVGSAELTWRDADGRSRSAQQRISRLQFAPSLAESAPSLQLAAAAAEVGQELTGARAALRELNLRPANSRGLAGILTKSSQLHSDVRQRPEFQRLMELVGQLAER